MSKTEELWNPVKRKEKRKEKKKKQIEWTRYIQPCLTPSVLSLLIFVTSLGDDTKFNVDFIIFQANSFEGIRHNYNDNNTITTAIFKWRFRAPDGFKIPLFINGKIDFVFPF